MKLMLMSLTLALATATTQAADSRCGAALATLATKAAMLQRFDQDLTDDEKTELFASYQVDTTRLGRAKRQLRKKMVKDSNAQTMTCVTLGAMAPLSEDEDLSAVLSTTGRTLMSAYFDEASHDKISKRQYRLAKNAVKNCRAEIIDLIEFAAKSRNVRKFSDEEKKGEYLLGMADRVADYCAIQGQIVAIEGTVNELKFQASLEEVVLQFTGKTGYWDSVKPFSDYTSALVNSADQLKTKASFYAKSPKIKDGAIDPTPVEIVPEYDDLYPRW